MKKNILIIKHGALGDIILAEPAMRAIREFHKNENIVCLTGKAYFELLKTCPWVDEVIVDLKPRWNNYRGWQNIKNIFKRYSFSQVYDLQTSYRTNIYFYLFFIFTKTLWSGIAYGCIYRHKNPNRKKMHTYHRQKDQLKLCGIKYSYFPNWAWLSKKYKSKLLLPKGDFAIIVPGASVHRKNKKWPKNSYATLINKLSEKGVESIILGTHLEKQYINEIISMTKKSLHLKPKNYAGKTNFNDIVYISAFAKYAIGNDTGPIHLLASTSLHTVVLFGSASDPKLCAPIGNNVKVIQNKEINDIRVKKVIESIN